MYFYDRKLAVEYAEKWWDSRNPKFPAFKDDCSNFISQCLYAGGFPMIMTRDKTRGWWLRGNSWSYSWSVAHAFMRFMKSSPNTRQVPDVSKLEIGDIICLDFEGDGRFNHTLIITKFDKNGTPLVNAHSYDSRHRNWQYLDSSAYTPNIKYKFFRILDVRSL